MTVSVVTKKTKSGPTPRPVGVRHLKHKFTHLLRKRSIATLVDRMAKDKARVALLEEKCNESMKRLEKFEKKFADAEQNTKEMDKFVAYLHGLDGRLPSEEEFQRDAEKWEVIANIREYPKLTEKVIKQSKKRASWWV